jgi:intracellular multiplication protein IcmE
MIGSFGKATANGTGSADRLVVRINTIEHQGQSIGVDAIVTAPETMETTVASSVDQHYLARFALPAAAAFVQGLGQALATTSNSVAVLSPLGGASYATQLNFPQQLGVGAGVAAQQLGNTLNQQAPRGPTVHLEANVNVGVMFLTDVRQTTQP